HSVRLGRVPERAPPPPAPIHRSHPTIAHLLERVGGQRGAVAAAAVEDDVRLERGNGTLDVALDDALGEVRSAADAAPLPLVVLAHVEQVKALAGGEPARHLLAGRLADAASCRLDQPEEARRVVHQSRTCPLPRTTYL